jgi:TPR repeat protein
MGPPPGFPTRSLSPTNVADATGALSPGRSRDESNAEVQYQIGLSLMYGTGHTDPQKALAWFRKAAEQKHILAMYHLGHGLWKSPGVQHDLPLAREWLTRAANLNCTFAQNSLAQLLARSEKNEERQQALRWFEKAADAGLPEAKANLGTMYAVGFVVQKDEARALGLTKQAAEGGLNSAMQQLGSWYEKGIGTTKDLEEAARWYQRAARAGNQQAQDALERLQSGCAVCGQKTEKRCLACGVVRYCGPEHQKADWPAHKHICRKVPSGTAGGSAILAAAGVSPAAAAGLTASASSGFSSTGSPSGSAVSSSPGGPALTGSGSSPLPTTEGSASAVQAQ